MMDNKFNFFVGLDIDDDIYKAAQEASDDKRYDNMTIYGMASDSSQDSDGEYMEPDGFDIKEFLKSGLLNLEHFTSRKGDPLYWIGEPVEGEIKDNKFFVKGKLWKHHPLARNLWDTLLIMKASNSTRTAGFSIEGKALQRHPMNKKRVTKAKLSHLAVTFSPKNKNSWADIIKGEQEEDFVKSEVEELQPSKYIFEFEKGCKTYGVTKSFEIEEKEDEEEKADTESTASLRKESIDKKTKVLMKAIIKEKLLSGKISLEKANKLVKKFL